MKYLVVIESEYFEESGGTFDTLEEAMARARELELIGKMISEVRHCDTPDFCAHVKHNKTMYFLDGSNSYND